MLDAAYQASTDRVLQDMLQRPAPPRVQPPKFSLWSTIGAGLAGVPVGVAEMGASGIDLVSGLAKVDVSPETMAASLTPDGRDDMQRQARETLETGFRDNDFARSLRSVGDYYLPDPMTSHAAEVVVHDFLRVATKAIGSMVALGPVPGAVVAGAEEGFTQADKLAAQGVDVVSRSKVGAVTGAVTAAGLALPVAGRTWAQTAGLALVGGPASFIGQNAANRAILEAADYDKQAQQFDPFDPVGLALSTLLPFGFGAVAMRASRRKPGPRPAPPEVEDAARVNLLRENVEAHKLDTSDMSPAHELAVNKALDQMAAGQRVDVADVAPPRVIESLEQFMAGRRFEPEIVPPDVKGNFIGWLRSVGGIDIRQKFDITGDRNGIRNNPGAIFRGGGRQTDELAMLAEEAGYIRPGEARDSGLFVEMVQDAVRGERVLTMAERMQKAAREDRAREVGYRLEEVERRLRMLGVDTSAAKGNLAAMEAYAKARGPELIDVELAEARRVDLPPEADELQARAKQQADDIRETGKGLEEWEEDGGRLSPVMRRLVAKELGEQDAAAPAKTTPPQGRAPDAAAPVAKTKAGDSADAAEFAAVDRAAADLEATNPDLLIQLDGMDSPMTLRELMAQVRKDADAELADAPLLEVAASCFIRTGAAAA